MKFSHPHYLFLLWGALPVFGIMVYGIRRHKNILSRFTGASALPYILPGFSYTRKWIKSGLATAGLILAVIALAGPRAGFHWEKTTQKGVDIMIALDCSRSMLAQDIKPSRLTRAKREIIDLTRRLRSDRAGLVAFSGQAVLQCPLTLDYSAFNIFLDALSPDYLPVGGTDLTAALSTCYNGFDPKSDTQKAIILITDGEDTVREVSELMEFVQKLAEEKIRIFAIGVGDSEGAPIPKKNGGFEKDNQGNIVLSKVDETMLKKITVQTGGRYVRSVAGDMDLELIYTKDILETMERKGVTQGKKKVWAQRFQWALLPAVLLLLMELMLGNRPAGGKTVKDPRVLMGLAVLVLALGAAMPEPARAGFLTSSSVKDGMAAWNKKDYQQAKKAFIDAQLARPDDLALYYNIGAAAYGAGEFDLAESNFIQAARSKDKTLRQNALFNLANTRYRQGRLEDAARDYETLVKAYPDDVQAKENLEFVKKKIEEEKQKQQQQKNNRNKDSENKTAEDKNSGEKDSANQDPGNKNPENKDNKGQNDPPQNKQDQGKQDKEQQQGQDQNNKEPQDKAGKHQDGQGEPDQAAPPPRPEKTKGEKNRDQAGRAQLAQGDKDKSDAGAKMMENRLNRLEDKPGMALIPAAGASKIEKDW